MGDRANHHVLRIADQGGRRADVAGDRQGDQKRNGIDLFAKQRRADDGRKDEANDVVVQERRQPAGHRHQHQQKPRGMTKPRGNAVGHLVIKAGQTELRRDDKKTEQQKNRRPVDVRDDFARGDAAEDHHGNRPQQNDAHAIEFQTRHASDRDAKVSDGEDRQDDRFGMALGGGHGNQRDHLTVFNPNAASRARVDL